MKGGKLLAFVALASAILGVAVYRLVEDARAARVVAEERLVLMLEEKRQAELELERERLIAAIKEARGFDEAPPERAPIEAGPPSNPAETATAILALLSGQSQAAAFPLLATQNGEPFELGLRDRLAPVGRRIIKEPEDHGCKCLPGEPLCSCF